MQIRMYVVYIQRTQKTSMNNLVCKLLLLLLIVPCHGWAKETDHAVSGTVVDNITGNGIAAKVTLMTVDSVVMATQTAKIDTNIYTRRTFGSYSFEPGVSKVGKYIIKAEAPGYETAYVNFKLVSNREQEIGLQTIQMAMVWQELPEVTFMFPLSVKLLQRQGARFEPLSG